MITNRELAGIPAEAVRVGSAPGRVVTDRMARRLAECSLDPVVRVMMRLLARAAAADPVTRAALLADADELDAAVRVAREVLFTRPRPARVLALESTEPASATRGG